MALDKLKQRAMKIARVPNHFELEIEDYFEGKNRESGEAIFHWQDPEKEGGVFLKMDLFGDLLGFSKDVEDDMKISRTRSLLELKKIAEHFIIIYYPGALESFTWVETKEVGETVRFTYLQEEMDIPIEHSGCYVTMTFGGEITETKYSGRKKVVLPNKFCKSELLIHQVADRIDLKFQLAHLSRDIYRHGNDEIRPVYEPIPHFLSFDAETGEPRITEEGQGPELTFIEMPQQQIRNHECSVESLLGIEPDKFDKIKEVDMGNVIGIVWREQGREDGDNSRSVDAVFSRKNKHTIKAQVDKTTGKLHSFISFIENTGDLSLNREQCFDVARRFLQKVIPEYHRYLRLEKNVDEFNGNRESFGFQVFKDHIPVFLQFVRVVVNQTTGRVEHYMGADFDLSRMTGVETYAVIDKETAIGEYLDSIVFKLAWKRDHTEKEEVYKLVYKIYEQESQKEIRFVDAGNASMIVTQIGD